MARYPILVDIAWNVVEQMIKDWQVNPFIFLGEHDIQSELYYRLTLTYKAMGMGFLQAHYSDYEYLNKPQSWNRVSCEPKIIYDWNKKGDAWCYPDVVVWDDIFDETSPPDEHEDVNFPMAWACEIKYSGRYIDSSTKDLLNNAIKDGKWDLDKLRRIVERGDLRYACAIHLSMNRSLDSKDGFLWNKDEEDGRIWICAAQLPFEK